MILYKIIQSISIMLAAVYGFTMRLVSGIRRKK